jgi:hypothetical protein
MGLFRRNKYVLAFLLTLVFCSVMVVRQVTVNRSRHIELREAFILLHSRGYSSEASRLYKRLLDEMPSLSTDQLMSDFQRTLILIDPTIPHSDNLIWVYHWTVSNELEKRSAGALKKALKLAGEN